VDKGEDEVDAERTDESAVGADEDKLGDEVGTGDVGTGGGIGVGTG
jgi:hypothetical protein